ncbi:MAG: hypothetical protein AB7O92_04320 [Acidimicrobiia bacterium]
MAALDYEEDRAAVATEGTGVRGLRSIGRNGEFDHILMEDTFRCLRRRGPLRATTEPTPRRAASAAAL